ncbi:MAG TPA: DUF4249 domain-containing protein [Chryseosolibacter sp.]|nr:DUF4249 domain-containing protein [Chryseosolibacter sp.]
MRSLTVCILSLYAASGLLVGCEVPYDLDVAQTPEKIVIEGLVTDNPSHQCIKISRSVNFYDTGKTPRVTNAVVSVSDELGNVFGFVHNPNNHPDSAGYYVPAAPFSGTVGRTYYLRAEVDGVLFEAREKLEPALSMDSLSYRVDPEEKENPDEMGRFYEVLLFAREPRDQRNFYLFKFFRNDTLALANDTDIYFSDDELLAENIDGVPAPVYFKKNDSARVEMYSISRVAYVYYSDLWALLNNDAGGMFGPIPSSPRTNLSNGALGFFQVSAVNISGIKIE